MHSDIAQKALTDGFGRQVHDLRISVTDRCNFRCTYCMPHEDMRWLPRSEILTFEEIERVARVFVERFGISTVRLTGGEPTVRAHLPELVARLARLPVELSMTTNGATLDHLAVPLKEAGLHRVTVSCDSLRADRFAAITGRDMLAQVLAGMDAAVRAGLSPVKVNAVLVRGVNDDEVRRPCHLRTRNMGSRCASSSSCRWTGTGSGHLTEWCRRARSSSGSTGYTRWCQP